MTKRIIDSMSADQIADGLYARYSRVDLEEYLRTICKPKPSWSDDASKDNPILCWVSDSPRPKSWNLQPDSEPYSGVADYVTEINERGYRGVSGLHWRNARPISPTYIWQPTKQGDAK